MKKIAPILLAMVLALTLCLIGFADAESYDDDPLEETAASTSEEALEEAEPVPARSSECAKCGEMRVYIQKISEYEAGPYQEPCIHKTAGTDAVYYKYCIYQEVCRGCGYKSLHGMFAAARQAESATVGKLFPGAADGLKNL